MGNGSLIVTSLRWNGDEALKLMSRADELEVRETWIKTGGNFQAVKHLEKVNTWKNETV